MTTAFLIFAGETAEDRFLVERIQEAARGFVHDCGRAIDSSLKKRLE
jgi:hypothetical protein